MIVTVIGVEGARRSLYPWQRTEVIGWKPLKEEQILSFTPELFV